MATLLPYTLPGIARAFLSVGSEGSDSMLGRGPRRVNAPKRARAGAASTKSPKERFIASAQRLRQRFGEPREPFEDRVRRGEAKFGYATFEDIALPSDCNLLDRLTSDVRMQPVFQMLAQCSDEVFDFLLARIMDSFIAAQQLPIRRAVYDRTLTNIDDLRQAVGALQKLCSEIVCNTQKLQHATVAQAEPCLLPSLNRTLAFLTECEHETNQHIARLSRKSRGDLAVRATFMCDMSWQIKRKLGTPHYEEVAALTNSVFNTSDKDDVSADAVRAAAKRAKRDRF